MDEELIKMEDQIHKEFGLTKLDLDIIFSFLKVSRDEKKASAE